MNADDLTVLGLSDDPLVEGAIDTIRGELAATQTNRRSRFAAKFFLAALGSIPWVGGYISALASFKIDEDTVKENDLQTEWLEEHHKKLERLKSTLYELNIDLSRSETRSTSGFKAKSTSHLLEKRFGRGIPQTLKRNGST